MNTVLVDSEAVDLLSRITGQKLSQRDLNPSIIFLAALITVLLGVAFADNTVTDEEKQRWQKTINRFIPPESNVRQLTQLISKGIRQNQVYKKLNELLTLTASLSESEKLLLISFGYEMSAADGEMDSREKQYLEVVANQLGINPQYLAVLEAGFSHKGIVDPAALNEVQSLLDPARFHLLDTLFVKAASDMLSALPIKPEHKATQHNLTPSYKELKKFQEYRKQLDNYYYQLFQILQDCNNRGLLPHTLAEEIGKVSHKLQSQRFRVAVVGEFSQGKSTLLNALLGEKIQPVRAIPCSGTVTVLRYGTQRLIVCRYKNGQQETIPFEQYQIKAAIPKDAALDCYSEHLASSDIDEIIFEHPDLELCRNGVEIIDSPGLNEHPDRTAITQKLLKNTDAVIFLANASRPLTKWEQDYLTNDLRIQLTSGNDNKSIDNLFILVNFMDLLDEEDDRQDVVQRFESFVEGKTPLIKGENRIHFISSKAALKAILNGTEDEYLKKFQGFTKSIEKFLTLERGFLKIKQSTTKTNSLIKSSLDGLFQAENALDGKLKITEEKQNIIEQIGEVSGRDIRIKVLADQLMERSCEQAEEFWNEWAEGLGDRIARKSEHWSSELKENVFEQGFEKFNQSSEQFFDNACQPNQKEKLFQNYTKQFIQDISTELNTWVDKKLKSTILQPNMEALDSEICQEIEAIQRSLQTLDLKTGSNLSNQFEISLSSVGIDINISSSLGSDITDAGGIGFFGSLGAGGLVAGALLAFTGIGLIPIALAGGASALGLGWLFGENQYEIRAQIKQSVLKQGFEKFNESSEQVFDKVGEHIALAFDHRVKAASRVIEQAISLSETLLEQQKKAHKETLEQREIEKAWITQKRQELEQLQINIEAILHQCLG